MKSKIIATLLVGFSLLITGCVKDVAPSDSITTEVLTGSTDGLQKAVNGAYALFKDHVSFNGTSDDNLMYLRQYFQLSDFASDDFVCAQVTEDPFFLSFTLGHTPTQTNTRYFWYISYKIINDANTVIDAVEKNSDPDEARKQLLGECYFLRAFTFFNLARTFARPYTQDPSGPGIILRTSLSDPSLKARSTIAETYAQIIADATKAAGLMNQPRGNTYATKEAAEALLSRVYLYQADNENTIAASNEVINSGNFSLAAADAYPDLLRMRRPVLKRFLHCFYIAGRLWKIRKYCLHDVQRREQRMGRRVCHHFASRSDVGQSGRCPLVLYHCPG